jgi:hypothetical protein
MKQAKETINLDEMSTELVVFQDANTLGSRLEWIDSKSKGRVTYIPMKFKELMDSIKFFEIHKAKTPNQNSKPVLNDLLQLKSTARKSRNWAFKNTGFKNKWSQFMTQKPPLPKRNSLQKIVVCTQNGKSEKLNKLKKQGKLASCIDLKNAQYKRNVIIAISNF